ADGALGLLSPWLAFCVAASVIAFYASARGLQKGEAVPVITLTSAAANISAIAGGILVFGDPMPHDPVGVALQCLAFALVVGAAALPRAAARVGAGGGATGSAAAPRSGAAELDERPGDELGVVGRRDVAAPRQLAQRRPGDAVGEAPRLAERQQQVARPPQH